MLLIAKNTDLFVKVIPALLCLKYMSRSFIELTATAYSIAAKFCFAAHQLDPDWIACVDKMSV